MRKLLAYPIFPRLRFWVGRERGSVAGIVTAFLFLGMVFVGLGMDYNTYHTGAQSLDSAGDAAGLAGGIECRKTFLQNGGNFSASQAAGKTKAELTLTEQAKNRPTQVDLLSSAVKVERITNGGDDFCRITTEITGGVRLMFADFLGKKVLPFSRRSVVDARLAGGGGQLEIDFLFDTSGSMSTIADPNDRDLVMALTESPEPIENGQQNGCTFICHSRRALLSGVGSKRIIDLVEGTISSLTASYSGPSILVNGYSPNYNGGSHPVASLHKPSSIKRYKYMGPNTSFTKVGDELVMLDDVLKGFNIKLKSDVLHSNVNSLIAKLKTSSAKDRISVAFHKISRNFRTVFPRNPGLNSLDLKPLPSVSSSDLALENFDYDVPETGTAVDRPYFFGGNGNASFAPVTGDNSVTVNDVKGPADSLQAGRAPLLSNSPTSDLTGGLQRVLRDRIKRRPPNSSTTRVVVFITDGLQNSNRNNPMIFPGTAVCKEYVQEDVIVMIIHTYYRFQPGSNPSNGIANLMRGSQGTLMRGNVNAEEKTLNQGLMKTALSDCASVGGSGGGGNNPRSSVDFSPDDGINSRASVNPPGGTPPLSRYYFAADDVTGLDKAFDDLLAAILSIPPKEPPVRVIE
jgi:hypothetical protein